MAPDQPIILIIDDEPPIRKFLRSSLTEQNYRISEAGTGKEGLVHASTEPPDVVLLDLGLPDMDGLEVTRRLRDWSKAPIIVLSARGQEKDKVAALDAGADDYLTKPFGVNELLARIRVALRRGAGPDGSDDAVFTVGELKVDLAARRIFVGEREVHLTPIEYRVLTTMVRHAGKVLTHAFLLKEVWGPPHVQETHYLRVCMASLRRKLEQESARPRYLLTEQGVGYRLAAE